MTKRPIDQQHDAAVTMQVEDDSDTSAIEDVISLPGRLLLIKELGIWQTQLADHIDPGRANPGIPNTMQKLLARGAADPLARRTLLQAKVLLRRLKETFCMRLKYHSKQTSWMDDNGSDP